MELTRHEGIAKTAIDPRMGPEIKHTSMQLVPLERSGQVNVRKLEYSDKS